MSVHGQLNIKVKLAEQGGQVIIKDLDMNLARPDFTKQMLVGHTSEQSIERITQLMTVCKHAQTAAAKLALGKAITSAEKQAIEYENIEQGFWRLVIDLPKVFALDIPLTDFVKFRQAVAQHANNNAQYDQLAINIKTSAEQLFLQLCQITPKAFYQLTAETYLKWLADSHSPMANCLSQINQVFPDKVNANVEFLAPAPDESALANISELLQTVKDFAQQPCLTQQGNETGALAVMQSHPLFERCLTSGVGGRFIARLLYLAQKIMTLDEQDANNKLAILPITGLFVVDENTKLAWVQTARGLLVHLANIQQSEINQYFIVAPTEWNFYPQGILDKLLLHLSFQTPEKAETAVKLGVIALDPCIDFNLEVAYA